MKEFKIILFINPHKSISHPLMEWLRQSNYNPIICYDPEEVRQCGLQGRGVMLFFDDIALAYRYLKENEWGGFPVIKFLWHSRKSSLLPDQKKMIDELGLTFFTEGQEQDLLQFLEGRLESELPLTDDFLSRRGEE
jgi:hypothetical protein